MRVLSALDRKLLVIYHLTFLIYHLGVGPAATSGLLVFTDTSSSPGSVNGPMRNVKWYMTNDFSSAPNGPMRIVTGQSSSVQPCQLDSGVESFENLLGSVPLFRQAVSSHLTHANPMTPSATGENKTSDSSGIVVESIDHK